MKKILTAVFLLSTSCAFSQDCKTQAANKPSTYDANYQSFANTVSPVKPAYWNTSKIKPHLVKVEGWMRNILKGFTGAKLLYGNTYFLDPLDFNDAGPESGSRSLTTLFYQATGFKGYSEGKMMFFAYYCYDNSNIIQKEDESGSNMRVVFNNVFASGLTSDAGIFTINGKPAFKIIQKKRSEGRIDFYEYGVQDNATASMYTTHDYIFLRNSDQPVFIPLTRKEYLQQMLANADKSGNNDAKVFNEMYNQNVKQFEAEMKVYKEKDKSYTPEKEAKRRKWFEEDQEKLKKLTGKISPDMEAAKKVILQYLQKPDGWLSKGFKNFYPYSSYTQGNVTQYLEDMDKSFSNGEEETLNEIVSINPAYFNNKLSADVPQLIMVDLQNGTYAHMKKVAALVKQPGALAPLDAMLNPTKQTIEQPVVSATSTYSLSYLPKLTKLPPLTVPADMKPSMVAAMPVNTPPVAKINFELPMLSPKLKQLPAQVLTTGIYKNYVAELHAKISTEIKPGIKKKADDYLANKKLTQSKDIGNAAFTAWVQNTPEASLYLYSKAVVDDATDALTANNFAAFLMMGGLPEKSIPILECWNKQKPGESALLANLGNAYYRLGDINNAMKYLQQCVLEDSLHPTANKLLCMMYMKKGDLKKAAAHATKSLKASYDQQVNAILRQLNNKVKTGAIMSQEPVKEFPLVKRTKLLTMPSTLDEMQDFIIGLDAEKKSLEMTMAAMESKMPKIDADLQQRILTASLAHGISPIQVKAQYIIMDGLKVYQEEHFKTADVFQYNIKKLAAVYNPKIRAITKQYNDKINKLEGGEAGDEDEIQALELAKCKEVNAANEKHLGELSALVNGYAQRQEFISRKFYSDYANWAPFWVPETSISFIGIERDYLKDIAGILGEYIIISKSDCSAFEPPAKKNGKLKEWEDEYCANFKGKIAIGPGKFFFTCNSWGMDGGEGIVGDFEFKFRNDGAFENLTVSAGLGANWHLGKDGFIKTEIGVSGKGFVKIGPDPASGNWIIQDVGAKAEAAGEASIGKVAVEEKVLELSVAVNAGFEAGGIVPSLFNLK